MRTLVFIFVFFLVVGGALYATDEGIAFPKIDCVPPAANYFRGRLKELPTFKLESGEPFQVDLRSYDVSGLDLRDSRGELLMADFDERTIWPSSNRMPEDFDVKQILQNGKNPGLGVRRLHEQGITGKGVGIAIIDQRLLVDHAEYAERLRLYEEIEIPEYWNAQMHGAAVASIAAGKSVGVAPEVDLYYIATIAGKQNLETKEFVYDYNYYTRGIERILEINRMLPDDRKIRVLSISLGFAPGVKGYDEITSAIERARADNMFVLCSSSAQIHGFKFMGMNRDPRSEPDNINSYRPGFFWDAGFYFSPDVFDDCLMVPMDSRTTASPTGKEEYVFYRVGGLSWAIPYIAGMYALAVQVKPDISSEEFWHSALNAGQSISLEHRNQKYSFGKIINPVALIEDIRKSKD